METTTKNIVAKFDTILALFEELETAKNLVQARSRAVKEAKKLFKNFDDSGKNDQLISDYTLEQYGYFRSLGLSIQDTAYSIRMSHSKLKSLLAGAALSLERFVELIQQELFARAECKARLLRDIEQSTNSSNWRTSLTLLEKLYPDEFGAKASVEEKLDQLVEKEWKINIVDVKAE